MRRGDLDASRASPGAEKKRTLSSSGSPARRVRREQVSGGRAPARRCRRRRGPRARRRARAAAGPASAASPAGIVARTAGRARDQRRDEAPARRPWRSARRAAAIGAGGQAAGVAGARAARSPSRAAPRGRPARPRRAARRSGRPGGRGPARPPRARASRRRGDARLAQLAERVGQGARQAGAVGDRRQVAERAVARQLEEGPGRQGVGGERGRRGDAGRGQGRGGDPGGELPEREAVQAEGGAPASAAIPRHRSSAASRVAPTTISSVAAGQPAMNVAAASSRTRADAETTASGCHSSVTLPQKNRRPSARRRARVRRHSTKAGRVESEPRPAASKPAAPAGELRRPAARRRRRRHRPSARATGGRRSTTSSCSTCGCAIST